MCSFLKILTTESLKVKKNKSASDMNNESDEARMKMQKVRHSYKHMKSTTNNNVFKKTGLIQLETISEDRKNSFVKEDDLDLD